LSTSTTHKILIIDDHAVLREALEFILGQQPDLEICGSVDGRQSARDLLASVTPDLAIVDLSLKDCEGMDLVRELHERHPGLPILVLSMHDEALFAEQAYAAGARGYVMKEAASERLVAAVKRLLEGDLAFSEAMTARLQGEGDASRSGATDA
jgi:DNA-binding NarL/FixJ family response regulator